MEEISLKEKLDKILEQQEEQKNVKQKKIKIPRKAKMKKSKIKKGWIGILKIDENGHISGTKEQIEGGAFRFNGGGYHATDGREVLFWEGKFPVIIQPTWEKNPLKVRKDGEVNAVYGQKYIMARMIGDTIKTKAKNAGALIWIVGIIAALAGINYLMGGGAA